MQEIDGKLQQATSAKRNSAKEKQDSKNTDTNQQKRKKVEAPQGTPKRKRAATSASNVTSSTETKQGQAENIGGSADGKHGNEFTQDQPAHEMHDEEPGMTETHALLPLIQGELRDYQLKGVRWLISLFQNGMNGILADEMGLGKTVQTIGFLSFIFSRGIKGPFLVLAPLSTLPNWKSEFDKWCPAMPTLLYHGNKDERAEMRDQHLRSVSSENVPIILTSYEIFMRDKSMLTKMRYKYLVVDEGHRLKNFDCKLIKRIKEISADNKLLLTGTPLQNQLTELWSLLNFLAPDVFANLGEFQSWFSFSEHVGNDDSKVIEAQRKEGLVSKLHRIISPYLLRREKKDVEYALPKKKEIVLYAQLAEEQRKLMQAYIDGTIESELQQRSRNGNNAAIRGLNNELMQLRKVCNHPDLLTSQFDQEPEFPSSETLMEQCGKLQLLERVLTRLRNNKHKVLIFSQMSRMLDLLEHVLDERGWGCCRIDGTVAMSDRQEQIRSFNEDENTFVFLLTTRAGGLGLNLMAADTAILYDSDFNPHADLQAMDRCHRIGQQKPVHVYRLITSNSIEEKMLQKAEQKLMLEKVVVEAGGFKDRGTNRSSTDANGVNDDSGTNAKDASDSGAEKQQLNANDLQQLLGEFKATSLSTKSQTISDAMLDHIMDRTDMLEDSESTKPKEGVGFRVAVEERANTRSLLGTVDDGYDEQSEGARKHEG